MSKPFTGNIEFYFDHYKELPSDGLEEAPYPMPTQTRTALQKIMASPLGAKIRSANWKGRIRLTLVVDPATAFEVYPGENTIYYTTEVSKFLEATKEFRIPGDMMHPNTVSLGVLLAHEIGHTPLGKSLICCAPTNPHDEEIWGSRNFENDYRKHAKRKIRRSYHKENDLIKKKRHSP